MEPHRLTMFGGYSAALESTIGRSCFGVAIATTVVRGSSFAAQLALGYLLLPEDFGLYAAALSFAGLQGGLRSVMRPVLIEALGDDPNKAAEIHGSVLAGLVVVATVSALLSPIASLVLDRPGLTPLLACALALMPFQLAPLLGLARMAETMQFARVGRWETIAGLGRHVSTVGAALLGLGPFCFLVGSATSALIENILVRGSTGNWPGLGAPDFSRLVARARPSLRREEPRRWVWISAVALTFGTAGDYLGASLVTSAAVVGTYFFAYQLVGSMLAPFTNAANIVLMPTFVKMDQPMARRMLYVTTVRSMAFIGSLVFLPLAVLLAPLVQSIWGGLWHDATFGVLAFAIHAPIRLAHSATLTITRAFGHWSLFLSEILLMGAAMFGTALVGARLGGLTSLVLVVLGGHVLVSVSTAIRLARRLGIKPLSIVIAQLQSWILGLVALGITFILVGFGSETWSDVPLQLAVLLALLLVLVVLPERKLLTRLTASLRPQLT